MSIEASWVAHLDGKVSTVDVVSQEQVASVCWIPADFKQFHQIILVCEPGEVNASVD